VQHVKKEFGLDFVYCWHALHAYWSGVSPSAAGVQAYGSQITFPTPTPGSCAATSALASAPSGSSAASVLHGALQ